ncbi:MAG: DUF2147 domain-containing protein [Pseudomonadota bacterium]
MRSITTSVFAAAAFAAIVPFHATSVRADNGFVGVWYDDTGRGAVELSQCGQRLCGRIVWLRKPLDKSGKPLTDRLNPKVGRRARPICGLQVIGNLVRQSDGSWDGGWIYDPKRGAAFDVELTLESPRKLRVLGYKGVKLFSKTLYWRRAPDNIERCSSRSS